MKTWKRALVASALVPALFGLAGCGENNESRVNKDGATSSPDAPKSSEEALKVQPQVNKQGPAAKGYPGAKNQK